MDKEIIESNAFPDVLILQFGQQIREKNLEKCVAIEMFVECSSELEMAISLLCFCKEEVKAKRTELCRFLEEKTAIEDREAKLSLRTHGSRKMMEHLKAKEKEILNHLDNFGLEFPKLDKFFRDVHKFYDSVLDIVATNEAKFDEQEFAIDAQTKEMDISIQKQSCDVREIESKRHLMQQEILQLRAETKAINIVDEQTLICVKTEDMAIDEHLKSVELEVASLLQFLEALEEENKELDKEIGTTQQNICYATSNCFSMNQEMKTISMEMTNLSFKPLSQDIQSKLIHKYLQPDYFVKIKQKDELSITNIKLKEQFTYLKKKIQDQSLEIDRIIQEMKLHDNQALQKELNRYSETLIAQKKIYSQVLVETMTGDVQNLEEIRKMLIETASLEAKNNRLNEEIMHMVTKSNMRKLKEYYFRVLHMDDNDQASSSSKTKDFVTLTDLQSAGTSASDYMTDKLLDSEDGSELKFKECFEFSFAESQSDAYSQFSLNPVMKKEF